MNPSVTTLLAAVMMVSFLSSPETKRTSTAAKFSNPKVRAITGFVRLKRANYRQQIMETLKVLRSIKAEFERSGYSVEDLRVTTQPVAELVEGMSEAESMAFLQDLDNISKAENFLPNVGPGMLRDFDDTRAMSLLTRALVKLPNIEASAIIAAEDGIHWKTIKETAALVRYVADHSVHSQGNFNFTATAMLQPYAPFYPGSYHVGAGGQFAIGFESANVVQEVFARTSGDIDGATRLLTERLTIHAKAAESIGKRVEASSGWKYLGLDATPAPLGSVSIAEAVERFTGGKFGSSGTLSAALV